MTRPIEGMPASLLAAIVESSDDAILSTRLDGTLTSWNPAAVRLWGYGADEVVGRSASVIVPADRAEELDELLDLIAREEHVQRRELTCVRKDGKPVEVALTLSPMRDGAGRTVGVSVIARDLTELRALEAQRRQIDSRLHHYERLESLGQLAGGIAHDFNNLLAVIGNYATFVADELDDPAAVRADLDQITAATSRAVELTRQLLAFAGRKTLQPRVVVLNDVIRRSEDLVRATIGPTVILELTLAQDLWPIEVDPEQIEQLLVNLATNARDAMPDGGSLGITTENVEIDDAYVEAHPGLTPGRYVRMRVSDTGVGMPPSVAARAFEPFFTTKAQATGTGLGLPMVFGVVTQAGGEVQLYSEPGLGTAVRILLPVTDRVPAVVVAEQPVTLAGAETILVVEDEDAVREAARRILEANGYSVLSCRGGHEAVALARHYDGPVHLLLTDVIMPGLGGREVVEQVLAERPGLPVLLMSGYARPELGERIPEDVLLVEKPFSKRSLLEKVRTALERPR